MKRLMLLFMTVPMLIASSLHAECRVAGADEFAKLLTPKVKNIVFFASWCKSCEVHLTEDYAKNSIFVAVFDKPDAANGVMQKFFGAKAADLVCVVDENEVLSAQYKVKFLPYVIAR